MEDSQKLMNKMKIENEKLKLELSQKKELEKSNQEEIGRLKENGDQVNRNFNDLKASQDRVLS